MPLVHVPRLGDRFLDWSNLFRTIALVQEHPDPIRLDFSHCSFLASNAVAALGLAISLRQASGRQTTVLWDSFQADVLANLMKNGFAGSYGHKNHPWTGNTIPFVNHRECNEDVITSFLKDEWIERGWINISSELTSLIVSNVWEAYGNTFEHSGSIVGAFSCGQYFPNMRHLSLTIADAGVGIPANVRNYLGERDKTGAEALKWAFTSGNSTKSEEGISRGVGLELIRNLLAVNGGTLYMFSGDGRATIQNGIISFQTLSRPVCGTLIHLTLVCDDRRYQLKREAEACS